MLNSIIEVTNDRGGNWVQVKRQLLVSRKDTRRRIQYIESRGGISQQINPGFHNIGRSRLGGEYGRLGEKPRYDMVSPRNDKKSRDTDTSKPSQRK